MRTITDHKCSDLNKAINVTPMDQPGVGGASHYYRLELPQTMSPPKVCDIHFQLGAIKEVGDFNGFTQEALLAVIIDRMRSFQAGPFSCRENAIALTHLETAMLWMHKRTLDREARGVEGTHQK